LGEIKGKEQRMKDFKVGQVIKHPVFGRGVIIDVYLLYCKVRFYKLETFRTISKDKLN
jgi:heat shock protein HspQ